jgi:hypothetical protein
MVIPFVRKPARRRGDQRAAELPPARRNASDPIPLVGHTDPWAWLLASSLKIDLWKLARFCQLMAHAGQPVHTGRMFRECAYAFECLSAAHATGMPELMALAVEMFEMYSRFEHARGAPVEGAGLFGAL